MPRGHPLSRPRIEPLPVLLAFIAGVAVALWFLDRLLGGHGPVIAFDEPGGGWGL